MDNVVTIAFLATAIYSLCKFIEFRFIEQDKEMKALKYFARDVVIVFTSVFVAALIYFNMNRNMSEFFHIITETKMLNPSATQIFTDLPGF
jgi:hypothetical protein